MKGLRDKLGVAGTALLLATATTVPITLLMTTNVAAQEITSAIQGTILRADGSPATDATATITDSRDGARRTATADSRGVVNFRSIGAGGPYTVRVVESGSEDLLITDLYTDIAGTSSFTVTLEGANAAIEEIVVTAAQIETIVTASGPSSSFSLEDITNMPSTQRQIRDVIRVDPRISIGASGDGGDQAGAISCLGGSSRTNSFTIDGVRATDAFGLNLSGNLARFTFPIPFDTVQAAAVEFAPVSVEYGQFSGCNINVVTKSGGNEFHGSGFYLYNDDGLTGDEIDGANFDQGEFERKNWGFDISGPIIQDKLFFYASYEETDTASINEVGAVGSGFPIENTIFTTAEVDQIRDILINQYGRDPGTVVRNLPVLSERIFARLDWNINDDHRLEGSYAKLDETTIIGDDIGPGSRGEFTFSDNFHTRGSDSETVALRFYSNWTDRLSTEFRYSTQEVNDIQDPLGGGEAQTANPIPRIQIGLPFGNEFFGSQFTSGPGTFRSANKLNTTKDQLKLKADYQFGDHLITGGYEYETLDVFNLFIINATGTVVFDSIASLAAGTASNIRQGVSFSQDPNDAAVVFTRDINSIFLQDQWDLTDNLQLIYGLRYDWYESSDAPTLNTNYQARYGLNNAVAFDGLDAIQPRIGLNYTLPEKFGDTRMTLGFGVFSGNDPTVWFSNAFQNFGGALGVGDHNADGVCPAGTLDVLSSGSFQGIPACVTDAGSTQAQNNAGAVNATDPNFDLPTVNRYSFGLEHNTELENNFLNNWLVKLDVIYSELNDSVDFVDLSLNGVRSTADGRPIYQQIDTLRAGCNATFNGLRQGFSNVTPECVGGNQDVLFTNKVGRDGFTFTTSIQAAKVFEWGNAWSLNIGGGYSYNDSEIANAGTSFTASTSFRSVTARDIVNPPVGISLRNTRQNFTLQGTLSNEFIDGHDTSITAFWQIREGNELSAVFNGGNFTTGIGDTGGRARNLLYIPTGINDPIVNFASGFDTSAFFTWVNGENLPLGQVLEKGGLHEDWQSDLDIRIQQEIPLFFGDAKAKIFLDIENVLNLLNDSNGSKRYYIPTDIAPAVGVVSASVDPATGVYTYEQFTPPLEAPDSIDTLYRIQFGIRGEF